MATGEVVSRRALIVGLTGNVSLSLVKRVWSHMLVKRSAKKRVAFLLLGLVLVGQLCGIPCLF